ncbi:MAG: DEAD/DEAH box helicase [Lentisphaeria bacterium]|nr:DEAD/DEAH box helicase [Lentisphaeria bacterium]
MIKPLASELIKSCLIENHLPEGMHSSGSSPAVQPIAEHNQIKITDLPGEFTTATKSKNITPEEWSAFRRSAVDFFAEDGPLKAAAEHGGRPYEYRIQQQQMAMETVMALMDKRNLAIEAPTGVGKSFAYLVPAILYSRLTGKPAVVTTETISLQEQLVNKDLPLLKKLMNVEFKAALAKGRRNYLCLRRLSLAAGEHQSDYIAHPSMREDIDRIYDWSESTTDGNRDNASFYIQNESWNYVCCEAGNCSFPKCRFQRECFYRKARNEWESADVIVANHALFFTDLAMQMESGDNSAGLLPVYGSVIIDEAHTLEDNAANHLGLHLTYNGFNAMLNKLYNPDTAKGLLMRKGVNALELRSQTAALKSLGKEFFGQFESFLAECNEPIRPVTRSGIFSNHLQGPLMDFRSDLGDFALEQTDADFRSELESIVNQCDMYIDSLHAFIHMTIPQSVYWVEADNRQLILYSAPLNVAEILAEELFNRDFPVITTSATLTVDRRFNYFINRTGFTRGITRQLSSPFDPSRVTLYVENSMPDPFDDNYESELFKALEHYISLSDGKAFVLFTSYAMLKKAAEALESFLFHKGIKLLLQGSDMSRSMLLNEFKRDVRSVLFGTDSFWTGVDVPGESVSNVIITKLPFAVPTHPLTQARCERIKEQGGNAFFDYSLPEAVLKFRQGTGRLIRSRQDSGMIVILDSRINTKRYGRTFINSLPPYPRG